MKEPENAKPIRFSSASGPATPGGPAFLETIPRPPAIHDANTEAADPIPRILALACRLVDAACCVYFAGELDNPMVHLHLDSAGANCRCAGGPDAWEGRDGHPGLPFTAAASLNSGLKGILAAAAQGFGGGTGTYQIHPIDLSGRPQGALVLIYKDPRPVTDKEQAAADAIANMLAITASGSIPAGAETAPAAGGAPPPGERPAAESPLPPAEPGWLRRFRLTPAEIRVAELIVQEKRSKEIAAALGLSTRTVEVHRTNIRRKLGITHRTASLREGLMAAAPPAPLNRPVAQ
jgi:DNA-binding CsgD family transcriptional regulator